MIAIRKIATLFGVGLFLLSTLSSSVRAEIVIAGKQFVMLQPGIDSIWGSYYFGVRNTGDKDETHTAPIMLPKESTDFQPQQGLASDDLKPGPDGTITFTKTFTPGLNVLAMGFKVDVGEDPATLTFVFPNELEQFVILLKPGQLKIQADKLKRIETPDMVDGEHEAYSLENPKAGQTFTLSVSGFPQGRKPLWVLGCVFAIALIAACVGGAYLTRPTIPV